MTPTDNAEDGKKPRFVVLAEAAWVEAEQGFIGPAVIDLVYDKIAKVARFDGYPPPDGFKKWTVNAVEGVGQKFFAKRDPNKRFKVIHAGATDATSFANRVGASVRNYLRDDARTTETGAVLRSLEKPMSTDPAIVTQGVSSITKTWALSQYAAHMPYAGPVEPLLQAAFGVPDVKAARWPIDSPHRPPLAEPESLRRVIHAVLGAAAAPLQRVTLAEVLQERFRAGIEESNLEVALETAPHPGDSSSDPGIQVLVDDIWRRLSPRQRLIVDLLEFGGREIEERTGIPRTSADRLKEATILKLRECLADCDADELPVVMLGLAGRSNALKQLGTERAGSSSGSVEEH